MLHSRWLVLMCSALKAEAPLHTHTHAFIITGWVRARSTKPRRFLFPMNSYIHMGNILHICILYIAASSAATMCKLRLRFNFLSRDKVERPQIFWRILCVLFAMHVHMYYVWCCVHSCGLCGCLGDFFIVHISVYVFAQALSFYRSG